MTDLLNDAFDSMFVNAAKPPAGTKIVTVPFDQLIFYENQHYRMYNEKERAAMVDSIKENGILQPLAVRPQGNKFEVLAGRNRATCGKLAGLAGVPCIIFHSDDLHAKMIVNSTNLINRQSMLPSEKAYGYRDLLDCIMKIAGATSSRTTGELAERTGKDRKTVQRYMRLAELHPSLLEPVDKGQIQENAGVELSYLSEENQIMLAEFLEQHSRIRINVACAKKLRQLESESRWNLPTLSQILMPSEPSSRIKPLILSVDALHHALPPELPSDQYENYILKAIHFYRDKTKGETSNEINGNRAKN